MSDPDPARVDYAGRGERRFVRLVGPGVLNPLPPLLGHAPVGCAEAPEIVPEGPGYRC